MNLNRPSFPIRMRNGRRAHRLRRISFQFLPNEDPARSHKTLGHSSLMHITVRQIQTSPTRPSLATTHHQPHTSPGLAYQARYTPPPLATALLCAMLFKSMIAFWKWNEQAAQQVSRDMIPCQTYIPVSAPSLISLRPLYPRMWTHCPCLNSLIQTKPQCPCLSAARTWRPLSQIATACATLRSASRPVHLSNGRLQRTVVPCVIKIHPIPQFRQSSQV